MVMGSGDRRPSLSRGWRDLHVQAQANNWQLNERFRALIVQLG
jgi:hypothetical protein